MIPWAEMMEFEDFLEAVHTREMHENERERIMARYEKEAKEYEQSFVQENSMAKIIIDIVSYGILFGAIIWAVYGLAK